LIGGAAAAALALRASGPVVLGARVRLPDRPRAKRSRSISTPLRCCSLRSWPLHPLGYVLLLLLAVLLLRTRRRAGESTPVCESSAGDPAKARPLRDRRDGARDASRRGRRRVAPMLATLIERGATSIAWRVPVGDAVCAASIVTAQPRTSTDSRHELVSREEHRYVEYGSSFRAAQRFGIVRQ